MAFYERAGRPTIIGESIPSFSQWKIIGPGLSLGHGLSWDANASAVPSEVASNLLRGRSFRSRCCLISFYVMSLAAVAAHIPLYSHQISGHPLS